MGKSASMIQECLAIRAAMMMQDIDVDTMRPFACTLEDLREFEMLSGVAGPPLNAGDMAMIAGIQFYVMPDEIKPIPFFGIWHEAWETCCRLHRIDQSSRERDRCTEQGKYSHYNPHKISIEGPDDG